MNMMPYQWTFTGPTEIKIGSIRGNGTIRAPGAA